MSSLVWAYSESEETANEVSAAATSIANSDGGRAVVVELGQARAGVKAERKLVLKSGSNTLFLPESAAEAIFRAARKASPSAVLVGGTKQGREVASRLAAKLGTGCMSEVFRLGITGQMLMGERNVFSGKVLARMSAPMPCVATIMAGAYPPAKGETGAVEELDVGEINSKVKLLQTTKKQAGAVDLRSAKVIVSAGRGVKNKEDLRIIEELAQKLGGALGCSRPLSSDLGWLPEECHIGLSGVTVRPDLYLAVGISGQLQHVAGIKDSRIIAAINSDKDAPIFQAADYGVVGDLYQVVPALHRVLASRRP